MSTTFYTIRMDTRQPTALVLAPGATKPEKLEHFFDAKDIHKHMQENFAPDVKQLPGSKFREEVERRTTHTLEMQGLLVQNGTEGRDLTSFYVYGSASRPVGSWAQIEGAVYIQVDRSQTGYYTYIAVPTKLDAEALESCDLAFVSCPGDLVFKQYRKVTPSRLRQLTEQDYHDRNGVVQTREGEASFQPGDYLGQDSKGEFRVRRVKVERDFRQIGTPDVDGWANYQPLDIRRAAQLSSLRVLSNGQRGQTGDYVVQGSDSQWIVERGLFEAAYRLVVAYRVQDHCYCHPECMEQGWEGEAITTSDLVLEADENLYFPGEYHDECTDRSVENICCIGCGQWWNFDNRLAGIEAVASKSRERES